MEFPKLNRANSANFRHMHGGDFPDDREIDVRIVVGNDVPHTRIFLKGEFLDGPAHRVLERPNTL